MEKAKKKKLFIILGSILLILALLAASLGVFLNVTGGKIIKEDGITQNDRIYLKDIYYQDGKIHYTLVNNTYKKVPISYRPTVLEKKVDGEWKNVPIPGAMPMPSIRVLPFKESNRAFEMERWLILDRTGEFRLIDDKNEEFAIVGYFTITEEMLAAS